MVKRLILIILILVAFARPSSIFAQEADCSTFSLNPASLELGEQFRVQKSDGLRAGEVATARILNSSIPQQSLDCEGNPNLCAENPVGLFQFDISTLSENTTYNVEIFYSNGANTCTETRALSILPAGSNFCSPAGLSSISSTEILQNEAINFSGCLGQACSGVLHVVINDAADVLEREVPIGGSVGSCSATGEFTTGSVSTFDIGVYTAQLYIGPSPVGNIFTFEVGSGQNQFPEEGDPCTVIESGMVCSGTFEVNPDNELECTYEASQCITCEQCATDPACTNSQRIQCENSTITTAGAVSVGCTGGVGRVSTAIGCIPFDVVSNTAKFFLAWGISIGGGVALLLIGVSGIMLATSSGNPDKVNSAKSLFWAAISGLLMLVLSIFLLRFIGVDVLGLFS